MAIVDILNPSGHLRLEWDAQDQEAVARARAELANLRGAGYQFFTVGGDPADAVAAGQGELLVERLAEPEAALTAADAPARAVGMRPMQGG